MLTKRTNILFNTETWSHLNVLASQKKKSVGELVRHAVLTVYFPSVKKQDEMHQAMNRIEKIKKSIKKPITQKEIKEWIAYGRK